MPSLLNDGPFAGFASPSSNTTYTPNQFFDVCLPHRSRGCVRIVAYMLRRTLGWSDEHGNPVHERFSISYDDLIHHAGVSRDMIRGSLDEAMEYGFIQCLRKPSANRSGVRGVSGLYELRWDERSDYVKDPRQFRGFFAGEGNRTYIPNQFFDIVVRQETLMAIKVVGTVARFSIGFTTKWGHRRQHASLSLTDIQRYAKVGNRKKLSETLADAAEKQYIVRVEPGYFDAKGGVASRAAVYSLRWLNSNADSINGRKWIPDQHDTIERSENVTGHSQKPIPEGRSEKDTGIQITGETNNNPKQHVNADTVTDDAAAACCLTLTREGFDPATATRLAKAYSIERVLNQIEWLPMRGPAKNRLGLLRRAIEQNYPKPDAIPRQYRRPDWEQPDDPRKQLAYKLTLKPR